MKQFDAGSVPASGSVAGAQPQRKIVLYVDSSASMRGFVAPLPSTYRDALNFLLDRISTAQYDLSVHRFSEDVGELGNTSAASLLSPSFYSGRETSFPRLFEHIARNTREEDIAVVVSDLVQSGRTGDQRALVSTFQKLTKTKAAILLLGFRSAFQGTYFVEGQKTFGSKILLILDGKAPERSRPFYVLLIAGSATGLEEIRNLLLPDIGAAEEFEASKAALPLSKAELMPPNPEDPPIWNTYKLAETLPLKFGNSVEVLSFLELSPPANGTSRLRLQLQCAGECATGALRTPRRLRFEIEHKSLQAGKWEALTPADLHAEGLFSPDRKHLTADYVVARPKPFSWDVYRIRVLPGMANLRAPLWSDEWTTPDDSSSRVGHRTFKLDLFVEAMIRSIQEQVPLSEHYLLLGRGE